MLAAAKTPRQNPNVSGLFSVCDNPSEFTTRYTLQSAQVIMTTTFVDLETFARRKKRSNNNNHANGNGNDKRTNTKMRCIKLKDGTTEMVLSLTAVCAIFQRQLSVKGATESCN